MYKLLLHGVKYLLPVAENGQWAWMNKIILVFLRVEHGTLSSRMRDMRILFSALKAQKPTRQLKWHKIST